MSGNSSFGLRWFSSCLDVFVVKVLVLVKIPQLASFTSLSIFFWLIARIANLEPRSKTHFGCAYMDDFFWKNSTNVCRAVCRVDIAFKVFGLIEFKSVHVRIKNTDDDGKMKKIKNCQSEELSVASSSRKKPRPCWANNTPYTSNGLYNSPWSGGPWSGEVEFAGASRD